jgi:hypothetical protein
MRLSILTTLSALLLGIAFPGAALAAPSAFPETAAFFGVGYKNALVVRVGVDVILPVPYLDVVAGAEVYLGTSGDYGVRLDGTALVFPAIGTTPPLALGLASDVGLSNHGFAIHAGPIVGMDLLFVSDLPMTLSLYLAPGYATGSGFSLAWAAHLRYYFDEFAAELASTDHALLSLSLRYFF